MSGSIGAANLLAHLPTLSTTETAYRDEEKDVGLRLLAVHSTLDGVSEKTTWNGLRPYSSSSSSSSDDDSDKMTPRDDRKRPPAINLVSAAIVLLILSILSILFVALIANYFGLRLDSASYVEGEYREQGGAEWE